MAVQKVLLLNQTTPVNVVGGLVPKGAYDNGTDYAVGDSVDYNGSSYVMFVNATAGTLPTDTTKWQVLANKGATGATGADGDPGAQGDPGVGVPTGGTTGQILAKNSDTNYDTEWVAPGSGSGIVETIVAGNNIDVDATDPANPIVSVETLTLADISDVTSSASELNILDGATLTTTELNYIDGVTSAIQTQIDGKQPIDSDLTTIAGLSPSNDDVLQRKAGAWTNRTMAQVKTDLVLVKGDVGLGNVDNTSDANKPVSTATQTALDAKLDDSQLDTDVTLAANSDAKIATQKATKSYVDAVAQGLSVKGSVLLATAAALPANTYLAGVITITATGTLTVDGTVTALNDRILVKDESAQLGNGIYKVTTAGAIGVAAVLTRSTDMDIAAEFPGAFCFVESGTVNTAAGFVCTNSTPPTVGTTAITFTQFSGAGEITAGAALTKSGNTLDVAVDNSSIEVSGDALRVKASGITSAMLAGSIDATKLADGSVTSTELQYIGGLTSDAQTQLDGKASKSGALTQFVGNGNHKVFYSDGSGDVTELALGADGTFLKSNGASSAPSFATPSGGGMTWSEVTGTTQSMSVNNGYIANNASLVVFTLPDTAALGSIVRVTGKGAGGWKISQNASEQIIWNEGGVDGTNETTVGTGGYLASTDDYDSIELICLTADTTWGVLSVKGNITLN